VDLASCQETTCDLGDIKSRVQTADAAAAETEGDDLERRASGMMCDKVHSIRREAHESE